MDNSSNKPHDEYSFNPSIEIQEKYFGGAWNKIYFENKPLLLRKIIAKTENEIISISFSEHNYNGVFEESLFSFVPKYLD